MKANRGLPVIDGLTVISVIVLLWGITLNFLPSGQQTTAPLTASEMALFVPEKLTGWLRVADRRLGPAALNQMVSENTYSETIEAIYFGPDKSEVLVSISYGQNQLDSRFSAHRPEYCYQSQGFRLDVLYDQQHQVRGHSIPMRQLLAVKQGRTEYISYWMTIDNEPVLPGIDRMLSQISAGLLGEIPDGLLVRVSALSEDSLIATRALDQFFDAWFDSLKPAQLHRLTGQTLKSTSVLL